MQTGGLGIGVEPETGSIVREGFISVAVQRASGRGGAVSEGGAEHQMPPEAPSMPMAVPEAESGEGSPQKNQQQQQQKKQGASMLAQRSRRRIFVQTDNGSVLGMEVHRSDKVQSIKKKVQEVLRVPTEQSALSFGDHVLEDDVRELRCDSPVLLTSELHRSSSTPCFCPSPLLEPASRHGDEDEDDDAGPFEIVGGWACCSRIKRLIAESSRAIECGVEPVRAQGGLGGAYYFRDCRENKIAIVKPADEEPLAPNNPRGFVGRRLGQAGLSRSIRVGETGVREVAAYLLDHGHFAQVPATVLVKASHPIFHLNSEPGRPWTPRNRLAKIGSFQEFVEHDYDASECGCSRFPASAVHRIGILDVRLFNTDRHAGNILVKHAKSGGGGSSDHLCSSWGRYSSGGGGGGGGVVDLIPIDHGLCLPESLEDPYFEWLHWPQASFPFSDEELDYIRCLDPAKDADMLRKQLPMLKEACVRMMLLCTSFLKKAAAGGLCLADIGSMMSREMASSGVTSSSELERMCVLARLEAQQQQQSGILLDEEDYCCSEEVESPSSPSSSSWEQQDMFQIDIDSESELPQQGGLLQEPASSSPTRPSFRRQQPGSPIKLYRSFSAVQEMRPVLEEEDEAAAGPDSSTLSNAFSSAGNSSSSSSSRISDVSSSYASAAPFFVKKQPQQQQQQRSSSTTTTTFASAATQKRSNAVPAETAMALSSMNEREWSAFLECFEAISAEAFARHAADEMLRPQHRLGTSCQF